MRSVQIGVIPWDTAHEGTQSATTGAAGPLQLARYAAPPNRLGYCGPADHHQLWTHAHGGVVDPQLLALLGEFDGALMYLRAITCLGGGRSALDARVVQAYWLGNRLLDRVSPTACARWLDTSLRARGLPGHGMDQVLPHHNFHVLCLYPWAARLEGPGSAVALGLLDGCRVRWGRVKHVDGTTVTVRSQPLVHDGHLRLGAPADEQVQMTAGFGAPTEVAPGDWVALHWDRVCDRLTVGQVQDLARFTAVALRRATVRSDR
ncbi:DUF6390 family protein [soil metagenome]